MKILDLKSKPFVRKILFGTPVVLFCGMGLIVYLAESKLIRLVPGGWGESFSTKLYSSPTLIKNNSYVDIDELTWRLTRLGYQIKKSPPLNTGEYCWNDPLLTIHLEGFTAPFAHQEQGEYKLLRRGKVRWEIKNSLDQIENQIYLEPELIAELSGPLKVRREPVEWNDIPPSFIHAVVAIEDRRFYSHHGLDFRSIARAAVSNLKTHSRMQGGSTITQQLAKNLFLTHQRTFSRKIIEAFFALYLDLRYSKDEILNLYLNHIYLGQDGFFSVAGIKSAAQFYFAKDVKDLSLDESALLAGLIQSPYRYNPFQNPVRAMERRNLVLKKMNENNMLSTSELEETLRRPLKTKKPSSKYLSNENDYFIAEVVRRMLPRYSEDMLFRYGLTIYTTVDTWLQKIAWEETKTVLFQVALMAISPETGHVLAVIGGKNFQDSQFNRATQAYRQPGSCFKPFVYAAALENGFTPATLLEDKPRAYSYDKNTKVWAPQNFDGTFRGFVPLRQALAQSINGATLDLAEKIGINTVIYFARKMGIESELRKDLTTALGSSELSLMELTSAYIPFANGGFKLTPTYINSVQDIEGNILELTTLDRSPVIKPVLSYLMTSLLESTIREGTAKKLLSGGWNFPAAGKTGTTNEGKDAWFIGYTSNLLAGVWIGRDDAKPLSASGSKDALPVWGKFMKRALASTPPDEFIQPQGIVKIKIDPISGLLARSGCPQRRDELFIDGTQPNEQCDLHAGGFKGWLQRVFGKKTPKKEEIME